MKLPLQDHIDQGSATCSSEGRMLLFRSSEGALSGFDKTWILNVHLISIRIKFKLITI